MVRCEVEAARARLPALLRVEKSLRFAKELRTSTNASGQPLLGGYLDDGPLRGRSRVSAAHDATVSLGAAPRPMRRLRCADMVTALHGQTNHTVGALSPKDQLRRA